MAPFTDPTLFDAVPAYPGDPILGLMEAFQADPRPHKASLGIGVYFDDDGRLPAMQAVRAAEAAIAADAGPRPYLPIEGDPAYRAQVAPLLLGAGHEAIARSAVVQTLGGSGALRLGAEFLRRHFPGSAVWVSDPTWDNHVAIFEGAGLAVHRYPYYNERTGALRFDAMLDALRALPARSIVLLHASCHNPTGVDLSPAQWDALVPVLQRGRLIPFVDIAYQGFGDGLAEDARAVRLLADAGLPCFVANSFSKNFSLYGERVGALTVLAPDAAAAATVLGQLKATVRAAYSTPPTHGARIVARVLGTPALRAQWEAELAVMRQRMQAMRQGLHAVLQPRFAGRRDFGFLLSQRGMFSYTGLSPAQVDALRERHGVYLVRSGRLCVSGLTTKNVGHVAEAIASVLA